MIGKWRHKEEVEEVIKAKAVITAKTVTVQTKIANFLYLNQNWEANEIN